MIPVPGKQVSVTFQTPGTGVDDGTGNYLSAWSTYLSTSGPFTQLSGDERLVGGQEMVVSTHLIAVPYSTTAAAITNKMRAVIGSTTYQVTYIENPNEENHHIEVFLRVYQQ